MRSGESGRSEVRDLKSEGKLRMKKEELRRRKRELGMNKEEL
jgi:hypothetical protein